MQTVTKSESKFELDLGKFRWMRHRVTLSTVPASRWAWLAWAVKVAEIAAAVWSMIDPLR